MQSQTKQSPTILKLACPIISIKKSPIKPSCLIHLLVKIRHIIIGLLFSWTLAMIILELGILVQILTSVEKFFKAETISHISFKKDHLFCPSVSSCWTYICSSTVHYQNLVFYAHPTTTTILNDLQLQITFSIRILSWLTYVKKV